MSNPTFIESFLSHTAHYESPGSFWRWSAYGTIAAVLKDNIYRGQGDSRLFPNIYILFLAESGGRKGKPIDFSETILAKVNNTKIISGRSSIQAILDEIARSETDKKTGEIHKGGSAIFYAQELAAGIVSDPESIGILTDIYDYKSNPYKSRLRTGPCFNLDQIVFSMMAGSNEEMLKGIFDEKGKKGGLLARTFLITPNESRPPNSLMRVDREKLDKSKAIVIAKLKEISLLKGEMVFTEEAIAEYEEWYGPFYLRYKDKKEATGAMARIHTGILKIAMILAANDLTHMVEKCHVEMAINDCIALLPNYKAFAFGGGLSDECKAGGYVLMDLMKAKDHALSRKEIIREYFNLFSAESLDKAMSMLEQGGMVESTIKGAGFDSGWKLSKDGVSMMEGK